MITWYFVISAQYPVDLSLYPNLYPFGLAAVDTGALSSSVYVCTGAISLTTNLKFYGSTFSYMHVRVFLMLLFAFGLFVLYLKLTNTTVGEQCWFGHVVISLHRHTLFSMILIGSKLLLQDCYYSLLPCLKPEIIVIFLIYNKHFCQCLRFEHCLFPEAEGRRE